MRSGVAVQARGAVEGILVEAVRSAVEAAPTQVEQGAAVTPRAR
jgi:hypothetical protein